MPACQINGLATDPPAPYPPYVSQIAVAGDGVLVRLSGVCWCMPQRRSNADERARERDFLHRVVRRLGGQHLPPAVAALTDSILAPIRAITRNVTRMIDAITIGKPKEEASLLVTEAEARIQELQPERPGLKSPPPGKTREWAEIFAGWRDRQATTATGVDTLVREWLAEQHLSQKQFDSVKKRFQRWEAKQPPVNKK